jgi:beta-glucosidase
MEFHMVNRRSMLMGGAALAAAPLLAAIQLRSGRRSFPNGFLWGAATSAHQVEGNNTNSDVWLEEHVKGTAYVEPSGDAANSFELWPTDLDLVKDLGLNAYRFSLEWARIEPEPGLYSNAMLDHYKAMIAGCHARGLTPVVTFNHFTTPRWFAARGGWSQPGSPDIFSRYCEIAARHLADGVGYATTLNEPNLAGKLQHLLPGDLLTADRLTAEAAARACGSEHFESGNSIYIRDPAVTQANLMRAHKLGRAAIKSVRGDLPVGVSLAILDDQAVGANSLRDQQREFFYGPWLRLARNDDFLGIQNYERSVWDDKGKLPVPANAATNTMGGEVYPASLAGVARYAYSTVGIPIMVTEHGVSTDDDRIRASLIPAALAQLSRAVDEGVQVLGYLHWSLIDNYEWGFGYRIHYGLHTLDRKTFERKPKPSARVLGAIAKANAVNVG